MTGRVEIGGVRITPPVALAPMAENTNWPFRTLALEYGAGLVVTEMVTTHPYSVPTKQTLKIAKRGEGERPLALQVCGNEPELFVRCAENANEEGYDLFDLNLGCPVRRMVSRNYGGGLMRQPQQVARILRILVKHCDMPVTVKIRSGFDTDNINAVDIARIAEDCGAQMIFVHARTVRQKYSGKADWDVIAAVRDAVSIPVLGNGDVVDGPSAEAMFLHTGCDGIMIGRASLGRPWIFRDIAHYFRTGEVPSPPPRQEVVSVIRRHAAMLKQYLGEKRAVLPLRRHLCQYSKGMDYSHEFKRKCQFIRSFEQFRQIMLELPNYRTESSE
ncbi:MAG: tRNA dihydrouridine synthase DusB [Planctomycetota bacterium]|nr:tRNA dihydrouridine synthase DusB [Planctomycetota bacterium]